MRSKFISMLLIGIFLSPVCRLTAAANIEAIHIDDSTGIIHVTGKQSWGDAGERVSISITGPDSKTVYYDQATTTYGGNYKQEIKINPLFSVAGTYTLKVYATNDDGFFTQPFSFNPDNDVYGVKNAVITGAARLLTAPDEAVQIGMAYENQTLTLNTFQYISSYLQPVGEVAYQWQVAGRAGGTYYDIPKATGKTYAFALNDDIKAIYNANINEFPTKDFFIRCLVKARTVIATDFCTPAVSTTEVSPDQWKDYSVLAVAVPYATNVTFSGTAGVGGTLTGAYTYNDFQNKPQRASTYRWLASSAENGAYTEVGRGLTYIPTKSDAGKYIKFEVTPRGYDALNDWEAVGEAVVSSNYALIKGSGSDDGGKSGGGGGGVGIAPAPAAEPYEPAKNPTDQFTDIPAAHWAKGDIDAIVNRGDANGTSETSFSPDANITRAEFAKLVLNTTKKGNVKYNGEFSDVSAADWYADVVAACAKYGFISGYDGMFMPDHAITREEMAKIIINAYRYMKPDAGIVPSPLSFTDAEQISDWATDYVADAAGLGMIKGLPDGSFAAGEHATRAQAVVVINRLHHILNAAL